MVTSLSLGKGLVKCAVNHVFIFMNTHVLINKYSIIFPTELDKLKYSAWIEDESWSNHTKYVILCDWHIYNNRNVQCKIEIIKFR